MPVRRAADPITVQHVWDAIRHTTAQRQLVDGPRIVKYLQKIDSCSESQAELYLKQSVQDGLVATVYKIPFKNHQLTSSIECYKIDTDLQIPKDEGKDWYCTECHLAGDITPCRLCFRVFHTECSTKARKKLDVFRGKQAKRNPPKDINGDSSLPSNSSDLIDLDSSIKDEDKGESITSIVYDESLCSLCNLGRVNLDTGVSKDELNYLMTFILARIKSWLPANLTSTMDPASMHEWMTEEERAWRATQLFYQPMDMAIIELKLNAKEYNKLSEFYADVTTVQHNVAVFHGIESQEYAASEYMLRDCVHDINELVNCADCYKHSNEKINDTWFCLPCRNPHKLVWAKQKGYPYWPAKVIRETDSGIDVRFFGGQYERALLPPNQVKPITTSLTELQIKKTAPFNKAHKELQLHEKLLSDPQELSKLTSSRPKKTVKERKSTPAIPSDPVKKVGKRKAASMGSSDVYNFSEAEKVEVSKRKSSDTAAKKKPKQLKTEKPSRKQPERVGKNGPSDVIDISDGDEHEYKFPHDDYQFGANYDSGYEQVTSSTEYFRTDDTFSNRDNQENSMHQLDQPYSDAVEKMRRKLEASKDKNQMIKIAMDCMQNEIDRITNDHNDHLKKLFESHNAQISETKKKQWCYNCEQDAIYHCCWNTAYCSQSCQQQHWQAEHKKVCRRKR